MLKAQNIDSYIDGGWALLWEYKHNVWDDKQFKKHNGHPDNASAPTITMIFLAGIPDQN